MDNKKFWIWLSIVFPYGSVKPYEIITIYNNPEDFYKLSASEMLQLVFLNQKDVKNIKAVTMLRVEKIIKDCEKHDINIVAFGDVLYPNRLKMIYAPPMVLYYKGNIEGIDDEVCITIVGTRRSTKYSDYTTKYLSYHIAKAGGIVISGCAIGIDTAAHIGALKAGCRTIAILACGLDINYPLENQILKQHILEHGALISELPPGKEVNPKIFAVRNRLMSGLALGVLVTHAPERSGSLITVEHAIEQGKDIYMVPPFNIFDNNFCGVVKYLRDGAIPVFSPKDILIQYYSTHSHKLDVSKIIGDYIGQKNILEKKDKVNKKLSNNKINIEDNNITKQDFDNKFSQEIKSFDDEQLMVYNKLEFEPKFIDEIAILSEIPVAIALSILTEFEMMGIVKFYSGRRYGLKEK